MIWSSGVFKSTEALKNNKRNMTSWDYWAIEALKVLYRSKLKSNNYMPVAEKWLRRYRVLGETER